MHVYILVKSMNYTFLLMKSQTLEMTRFLKYPWPKSNQDSGIQILAPLRWSPDQSGDPYVGPLTHSNNTKYANLKNIYFSRLLFFMNLIIFRIFFSSFEEKNCQRNWFVPEGFHGGESEGKTSSRQGA